MLRDILPLRRNTEIIRYGYNNLNRQTYRSRPMRSIVLLLVIIGLIPAILVKPHIGVLVWSWIGYMNPHQLVWGWIGEIRFAQIIALLTLLSWVVSREPKRIPWHHVTVLVLLFWLWCCWTTVFALAPEEAKKGLVLFTKILLMFFVTMALINTRERLNMLVWVIVLSIGFFGVKGGIFVLLSGGNYMVFGPPKSFLAANNSLALALAMTLPLMRYLQLQSTALWARATWFGAMGLCGMSILSSYSRGAFLTILAMAFFMWFRSPHKIVLGFVGFMALAVGIMFMPDKWFDRIETIKTYEQDGSAMTRLKMWRMGFNIALSRPFVGGGFKIYPEKEFYPRFGLMVCDNDIQGLDNECVATGHSSHSIYFQVLGEHGFIGLAIFLLIAVTTFFTGNWVMRHARDRPDLKWAADLTAMVQVSMVSFAVGGLFLNKAYFDLYYHLIAIMVLAKLIVAAELKKASASEKPMPVQSRLGPEPAT